MARASVRPCWIVASEGTVDCDISNLLIILWNEAGKDENSEEEE
jgi:hypothetical protein